MRRVGRGKGNCGADMEWRDPIHGLDSIHVAGYPAGREGRREVVGSSIHVAGYTAGPGRKEGSGG